MMHSNDNLYLLFYSCVLVVCILNHSYACTKAIFLRNGILCNRRRLLCFCGYGSSAAGGEQFCQAVAVVNFHFT